MVDRFKLDYCRKALYDIDPSYYNFATQYGSLTSVKYKKTFFNIRRLNENNHFTVIAHIPLSHFSTSIFTLNCYKSIFSKCGRHSMLLSLLHCIYICMKKSMYSQLTSNLLISFGILPTHMGSCLRESM